jgi:hypothetical protein
MEEESEIAAGGIDMPAGSIKVFCPVVFVIRVLLSGLRKENRSNNRIP